MIVAVVRGSVWATKRLDGFPSGALLDLEGEDTSERLVALDSLGCGPGDRVLVVRGAAAAQRFPKTTPVDAIIVGILDNPVP